jgi:hypothetical protein
MATHPNFFENLQEAQLRLHRTIVLYDGSPYVVFHILEHKDGILRLYLYPPDSPIVNGNISPPNVDAYLYNDGDRSKINAFLDQWMLDNPKAGMIRKQMNSPLFNKFRPFPLGMVNTEKGMVYYVERQPTRKTEQGLTTASVDEHRVSLTASPPAPYPGSGSRGNVSIYSKAFCDTIEGKYPTAMECLTNLLDDEVLNNAAAFDRQFALIRGPIGMIFLGYKTDVIGVLPFNNFENLKLGRKFRYLAEVVAKLGLFEDVSYQ